MARRQFSVLRQQVNRLIENRILDVLYGIFYMEDIPAIRSLSYRAFGHGSFFLSHCPEISRELPARVKSRAYREIPIATARKFPENFRREQNPGHIGKFPTTTARKFPENCRCEQNPWHIEKFLTPLPRNFLRTFGGSKIPGIQRNSYRHCPEIS